MLYAKYKEKNNPKGKKWRVCLIHPKEAYSSPIGKTMEQLWLLRAVQNAEHEVLPAEFICLPAFSLIHYYIVVGTPNKH